jgi:hypothetical protein
MTASQNHGFIFENEVIQKITGMPKKEYEKLIPNGYTSPLDLHKGIGGCNFNGSIKSTKSDGIGCGDILTLIDHVSSKEFKLIIGSFKQKTKNTKSFNTVYEFFINPGTAKVILGDLYNVSEALKAIEDFDSYVKSIPKGEEAQQQNSELWKTKRDFIKTNHDIGLLSIDAKIDSKNQRRVQCSLKIKNLIGCGIDYIKHTVNYEGIELPYGINSFRRSFKKS